MDGRLCLEQREVALGQVREAVDAFELLIREREVAEARLHKLAAHP